MGALGPNTPHRLDVRTAVRIRTGLGFASGIVILALGTKLMLHGCTLHFLFPLLMPCLVALPVHGNSVSFYAVLFGSHNGSFHTFNVAVAKDLVAHVSGCIGSFHTYATGLLHQGPNVCILLAIEK